MIYEEVVKMVSFYYGNLMWVGSLGMREACCTW